MATYVEFSPRIVGPAKLTKEWHVVGIVSRTILGEIKWHAPWRRYTFHPAITHQCIFDARCLQVITEFLDEQTEMQKGLALARKGTAP